jgi:hypothetical protein
MTSLEHLDCETTLRASEELRCMKDQKSKSSEYYSHFRQRRTAARAVLALSIAVISRVPKTHLIL